MKRRELIIGNRRIGSGEAPYVIAEACDNHMGNMEAAKEMCIRAKLSGADCIKFQHHIPDEEMLRDVPQSSNFDVPLYDFLVKHALTLEQHAEIMSFCKQIGIQYLCTPFSYKAAVELNDIGVDAFKIGSGEMTDIPTLLKIANFGKPIIISTGMSSWEEMDQTYKVMCETDVAFAFMDCVSEYPPVYEDVNLGVIQLMKERYREIEIGHSDHTPDLFTCFAASVMGAGMIEKHVILDKKMEGPDQSVSIDFEDLYHLCDGLKKIHCASGKEKKVHEKEYQIREWALHSIVSTRQIKAGTVFDESMLCSKRPGTGIPVHYMKDLIGRKAQRDIKEGVLVKWDDVQ